MDVAAGRDFLSMQAGKRVSQMASEPEAHTRQSSQGTIVGASAVVVSLKEENKPCAEYAGVVRSLQLTACRASSM